MKRFVAVCTCRKYYGFETVVVGVDATTAKAAKNKAGKLATKVLRTGKFDVAIEPVTTSASNALEDKCHEQYLFESGSSKQEPKGWDLIYPFWRTACWDGDIVVAHGVRVVKF